MPTLMYFDLQGRAQAIRFLLQAAGVEFEDQRLTGEQWRPIKEAGTYGEGGMPIYIDSNGTYYKQSMAILKMLAFENGFNPETPLQEYEAQWHIDTMIDCFHGKPAFYALFKDDATEEDVAPCIEMIKGHAKKLNDRYADGRTHAAGDKITYADFILLTNVTSILENPGLKSQFVKDACAAIIAESANIQRVVQPLKERLSAQIAALPRTSL